MKPIPPAGPGRRGDAGAVAVMQSADRPPALPVQAYPLSGVAETSIFIMKVLSITTLFPNQAQPLLGVFIRERLRHMNKFCEVKVVAPVVLPPGAEGRVARKKGLAGWLEALRVSPVETQMGIEVHHPRIYHLPKVGVFFSGLYYFLFVRRTVSAIRESFDFDVIDAHWVYPDGFAAVMLGKRLGLPVVVSCRGSDVNRFSRVPVLRRLVSYTLRECTAVITVSQALKDRVVELGIPEEKVKVIPNGIDTERFVFRPRKEARKELGLPADKKILLSVGHLVKRKGFPHLVDAMDVLVNGRGREDLLLLIVGDGPQRGELERLIERYSLGDCVRLLGAKRFDEVHEWYGASDIFCLMSYGEGWPNVIFEAMACGNPVIATDVGGISEIVSSEDYGIVIEDRSMESVAGAIEKALARGWDREKIVEYARANTWHSVGERAYEFLNRVVEGREGAA